jgi:serine/threonine protein kinase
MPDRLAYDEAIVLGQARLKVADSNLKQGKVAMTELKTHAGLVKRPWGLEGAFAVVYKFTTSKGEPCALRCFKMQVSQDMQTRYEQLGAYFRAHAPDITTQFTYYNTGIEVEERLQGKTQSHVYPLIAMDWIEGETLLERVDALCKDHDQAGLDRLAEQWLALLRTLRQARIAHGDLAGGNVMVRKTDGSLVLVDYDGACIPTPAFEQLPPVVQGQPDYQHPQMKQRKLNEWMDAFSALVIYTALLALRSAPTLWDTYTQRTPGGHVLDGNLLFTQEDFEQPEQSSLFRNLEGIDDRQLKVAVQELKRACTQPIDDVRFPLPILDPDYDKKQALKQLQAALDRRDDRQTIQSWIPLLADYPPARSYYQAVIQARQRLEARQQLRHALSKQQVGEIAASNIAELENDPTISPAERAFVEQARSLVLSLRSDDDEGIARAWDALQQLPGKQGLILEPQQRQRIELAKQRQAALARWRAALYEQGKLAQRVVDAYDAALLDTCINVSPAERQQLELARRFLAMYQAVITALALNGTGDDEQVRAAYDPDLAAYFTDFTPDQEHRIAQARYLVDIVEAMRERDYPRALELAQTLEQSHHETTTDIRLSLAKRKFIRGYDVKEVEAVLEKDGLSIHWQWPDEHHVQQALVCLRADRYPSHPRKMEPGTMRCSVLRSEYQQHNGVTLPLDMPMQQAQQVYVRVYTAIRDDWTTRYEPAWYYSDGFEWTARCIAHPAESK